MSPGGYGPMGCPPSHAGPNTPIMPSPQDSSNSPGDGMYPMMKPSMPGV